MTSVFKDLPCDKIVAESLERAYTMLFEADNQNNTEEHDQQDIKIQQKPTEDSANANSNGDAGPKPASGADDTKQPAGTDDNQQPKITDVAEKRASNEPTRPAQQTDLSGEHIYSPKQPESTKLNVDTIVPGGLRLAPSLEHWDESVITSFGFPIINLTSTGVKNMAKAESKDDVIDDVKQFIKDISDVPTLYNIFGKAFFRQTTKAYNMLKKILGLSTVSFIRNYLIVSGDDMDSLLSENTESDIACRPVSRKLTSIDTDPISLAYDYITQYYACLNPLSPNGAKVYMKLGANKLDEMQGENIAEKYKAYLTQYQKPPFYLLIPRQNPRESISATQKPFAGSDGHSYHMVKTVYHNNKGVYFLEPSEMEALFTRG